MEKHKAKVYSLGLCIRDKEKGLGLNPGPFPSHGKAWPQEIISLGHTAMWCSGG